MRCSRRYAALERLRMCPGPVSARPGLFHRAISTKSPLVAHDISRNADSVPSSAPRTNRRRWQTRSVFLTEIRESCCRSYNQSTRTTVKRRQLTIPIPPRMGYVSKSGHFCRDWAHLRRNAGSLSPGRTTRTPPCSYCDTPENRRHSPMTKRDGRSAAARQVDVVQPHARRGGRNRRSSGSLRRRRAVHRVPLPRQRACTNSNEHHAPRQCLGDDGWAQPRLEPAGQLAYLSRNRASRWSAAERSGGEDFAPDWVWQSAVTSALMAGRPRFAFPREHPLSQRQRRPDGRAVREAAQPHGRLTSWPEMAPSSGYSSRTPWSHSTSFTHALSR